MKALININKKWLEQPISERSNILKETIKERYATKYDPEMIEEFLVFWAYYEDEDDTMKFEEVKGGKFHVGRRLATWFTNYKRTKRYRPSNNRTIKDLDFDNNETWARMPLNNISYDK